MCITFFSLFPWLAPQPSEPCCHFKPLPKHKKIRKLKNSSQVINCTHKHTKGDGEDDDDAEEARPRLKFVIAFNRDQQCERRTLKLAPFQDDPNIHAGRDIKSTGTWLGVNQKTAIMVILTNYDIPYLRHGKSRGQLVKSFLSTSFVSGDVTNQQVNEKIQTKLKTILEECHKVVYPAFNLVVFNLRSDRIFYICSEIRLTQPIILEKGKHYGLCNTDLNTVWPKTKHGLSLFDKTLAEYKGKDHTQLFDSLSKMMRDTTAFSKNPNDEASIFIEPFFSTIENAERMTKSTFIAILTESTSGSLELEMRETTHEHIRSNPPKNEGRWKGIEYDHKQEKTMAYKIKI